MHNEEFSSVPAEKPLVHEARLLAQLLRSGRVVLLLGEPLSERSGLIRSSLVPLLGRRMADGPACAAPAAMATHRPERRQGAHRIQERVVVFDRWTGGVGGPLAHLRLALAAALGVGTAELEAAPRHLDEALAVWTQAHPTQVFLLLDHFEDHLLAPHPGPEHAQVTEELVRTLTRPGLRVSVLLSLSEAAQPQLLGMRSLVPGLEDMSLRLKAGQVDQRSREPVSMNWPAMQAPTRPGDPPPSVPDVARAPVPPVAGPDQNPDRTEARRALAEKPPIRSDDVYALINSTLSRVATGSSANPLMDSRTETSEPAIEAFQADPPAQPARDAAIAEPFETERPSPPDSLAPPTAYGVRWWQRLLRQLRRKA